MKKKNREFTIRERQTSIQRSNFILFNRICDINRGKSTLTMHDKPDKLKLDISLASNRMKQSSNSKDPKEGNINYLFRNNLRFKKLSPLCKPKLTLSINTDDDRMAQTLQSFKISSTVNFDKKFNAMSPQSSMDVMN